MLVVARSEADGVRLRRVDKWNDLFRGEVGSKKHEISTNRLSVDQGPA